MRAVLRDLHRSGEREIASRQMGEYVMRELKRLDQVAYVRFASVYRRFEDVQAFREEIEKLERDLPAIAGLQLPLLIGGAVVIEQIFVISGMGQLLLMAVSQRDYPVITGIFLLVGVGVMTINLLVDISYALLDPKIRQG